MRIGVTYEDGQIFQHFGHTQQFKLYDIEAGDIDKAKERLETALEGFTSPLNYATPELIRAKLKEIDA